LEESCLSRERRLNTEIELKLYGHFLKLDKRNDKVDHFWHSCRNIARCCNYDDEQTSCTTLVNISLLRYQLLQFVKTCMCTC